MIESNSSTLSNECDAPAQPRGHVFSVSGAQVGVRLKTKHGSMADDKPPTTVGSFLVVQRNKSLIIGVVTNIISSVGMGATEPDDHAISQLDLLGEIKLDQEGTASFQRGITEYPVIGDSARLTTPQELRLVVDVASSKRIMIGNLVQDSSIPVFARAEEMLCKHFAIFGATGVGKSSGVALILRGILETLPNLRIFLIDPHNEYRNCFEDRAKVLNPRNLKLPFWLFNFEEAINVLLRGRSDLNDEVEILSEMIPLAKALYAHGASSTRVGTRRSDLKNNNYTVDTPVPYRLHDLVGLINERMGKLESLSMRMRYHRLIGRIEAVSSDPRYGFMFDSANTGGDTMAEVLGQLFRLPAEGKSVTVMQLAGFPADVIDPVVSVLCRMAFDFGLWSDGVAPLLFVCEEAHRYAPTDRALGFEPTRRAVSRIAKEGRKYGVYLGLVTQRPAELDPTIISQCSTIFTMRMANDRDQAIIRAAAADAAANQLNFVPALGAGEVIAFGEGVALPIRLRFAQLPEHLIPRAKSLGHLHHDAGESLDKEFTEAIVDRWRGGTSSRKVQPRDTLLDVVEAAAAHGSFNGTETGRIGHDPVVHTAPIATRDQPDPIPARRAQDSLPAILSAMPNWGLSDDLQELRERLRSEKS